eukprot:TRINITY_DN3456_c4_g1_i1.p1 TRINITY_DN3456_c4_g1~~TRINITY_DN3456_c4_g1_i1.p1  ORF type:complete len:400 (-),score=125.40 TRINITY_DN3456_c4_g1_i1:122-1228(-)
MEDWRSRLISSLRNANKNDQLIQEIEKTIGGNQQLNVDPALHISLFQAYVNARSMQDLHRKFAELQSMIVPQRSLWEDMIIASQDQNITTALKGLSQMIEADVEPSEYLWLSFIDLYIQRNSLDAAIVFLNQHLPRKFHPGAAPFGKVIHALGRAERFHEQMRLFDLGKQSGVPVDIKTWTIMISSSGRARNIPRMLRILDLMKRENIQMDSAAWTAVISAIRHSKVPIDVEAYIQEALTTVIPEEPLWNSIIQLEFILKNSQRAQEIFSQMQRSQTKPSLRTYNILLSGFSKNFQLEDMLKFFQEIKSENLIPDEFTYTTVVHALSNANHPATRSIIDEARAAFGVQKDTPFSRTIEKAQESLVVPT